MTIPRHQLFPLPDQQVSFQVDGVEKTCWHCGDSYPRPFFYPFNGPSDVSLTRMGHPGAPNHDHHRSIWFAHKSVDGIDFWTDTTEARICQKRWLAYVDGEKESIMAVLLEWIDGQGVVHLEQEVVAALMGMPGGEYGLEIQMSLQPPATREKVELDKTNFGLLAVRMARSVSDYFGGGTITSSAGQVSEPTIFGKRAQWMDYSGPVAVGTGADRRVTVEGITYFDHPSNPRYPSHWHVREDGWMGASFCMQEPYTIMRSEPLVLRYLLYAHAGAYDPARAKKVHTAFARQPGFEVTKGAKPHIQFDVERMGINSGSGD